MTSKTGDMIMSSKSSSNKIPTESPPADETSSCSKSMADRVASCALDHYHKQLTKKAKPKPGQEWTVFAAIVAFHRSGNRMWVVSSATGTKCTAQRHNEFILHDSHAEVLARRGFIRILFDEMMERQAESIDETKTDASMNYLLVESTNCSNENVNSFKTESTTKVKQYRLDPDIGIHLYISDSPCGDASIYPVPSSGDSENSNIANGNEILYTGAKVIVSKATKVDATDCGGEHQLLATEPSRSEKEESHATTSSQPIVAREAVQSLGKLRTKSGRSNLPAHMRSHSHSCSDKIVLWGVLGLQGAMLTKYLDPPIVPLTSVVVSIDSRLLTDSGGSSKDERIQQYQQQIALERAIPDRVRNVWESLKSERLHNKLPLWKPPIPTVHIVRNIYESGKAAMIASSETKNLSGNKRKYGECSEESDKSKGDRKNKAVNTSKKIPPCGMSFNWNHKEGLEVLVGSRGIKHGKKPKTPQDIEKLSSRLCRANLVRRFLGTVSLNDDKPYFRIKNQVANSEWSNLKTKILTQDESPLAGWLRCIQVDDNSSNGELKSEVIAGN